MKKLLILLLATLTLLSLAACGDNGGGGNEEGEHSHSFTYVEQVPATCTTESYHLYKCECNEERRDTVTTAMGHAFFESNWQLKKEPTLTESGHLTNECTRCGEKSEHILPSLNETDYNYTPAQNLTCESSLTQAIDNYHVQLYGTHYNFKVQIEVPAHNYQPVYTEYEYSERCVGCQSTKVGTWHPHTYELDNYKGICSICDHESAREVFKVTAIHGTTIVGTLSHGPGSERLYFDEPVTEAFAFKDTYVIAAAPEGPYYDCVDSWHTIADNESNRFSSWSEEYDLQVWRDSSIYAEMDKKQAQISILWSNGLKDSEGVFVRSEGTNNGYTYYNVNLGDTYTLVPAENTEVSVFLGWSNGSDDFTELFTNNEIVITEGTTDEVLAKNSFMPVSSSLTGLLPYHAIEKYILVSGYLYNTETMTITKYDTPTVLPLNSANNMDIKFVNYYNDVNALYVKNVNDEGKILARGLYYEATGGEVYCLTDSKLDFRHINYTVSPENVTVNGEEYCEFKFLSTGSRHTNLDLYWGKSAEWMYQGHTLAGAYFYLAASPENYLDVSDISVSIIETDLRKLSTVTVSLNSIPTEEELIAYYVAFMSEYLSYNSKNLYTGKPCTSIYKLSSSSVESQAQSIFDNDSKLYMWLTNYYCCEIDFSVDEYNSTLTITLEELYKN